MCLKYFHMINIIHKTTVLTFWFWKLTSHFLLSMRQELKSKLFSLPNLDMFLQVKQFFNAMASLGIYFIFTSHFTVINSTFKKSSFLKLMILLKFLKSMIFKYLFNILMMLKNILFNDFHLMLLSRLNRSINK